MQEALNEVNQQLHANQDALTDEELAARGMVKIHAFARAMSGTTDNARRSKRAREKSQASGARQLNVVAPVDAHEALRRIAKDLQHGVSLSEVLKNELVTELLRENPQTTVEIPTGQTFKHSKPKRFTLILAKWKGWLSRVLNL